jgi:hypothetical protein
VLPFPRFSGLLRFDFREIGKLGNWEKKNQNWEKKNQNWRELYEFLFVNMEEAFAGAPPPS